MPNNLKRAVTKLIQTTAPEWVNEQLVRLGNYSGTVLTPTPGRLYARQNNGKVIVVYNGAANVPAIFDLRVLVGRKKSLPNIWQIIQIQEDYDTPAASGEIAYHHAQHEFPHGDTVWVDRKQLLVLDVLVSDGLNFIVNVFGGIIRTGDTYIQVSNQAFDLSAYVVATGAMYVNIEADDTGTLSANDTGNNFGAPAAGSPSDIPVPADGNVLIATVLMYEAQAELLDAHILIPWTIERGGVGAQTFSAVAKSSIDDDDLLPEWDSVSGKLRSVLWTLIKSTLQTFFDAIYSAIGHTHAPPDVPEILTDDDCNILFDDDCNLLYEDA